MKIKYIVRRTKFLPLSYLIMLLVIFILPYFSFPEYTIIRNTSSHLGSQLAPNAAIMNATFFLLGFASIIDGWRVLRSFWFHKITLVVFGCSLIACAYYQHAPIIKEIPYDIQEDKLHSIFANLTGMSYVIFAIASSFVVRDWFQKILAIIVGIIVTLLSILMFEVEELMGIWQRLIFIISFGWMVFIYNKKGAFTKT